MIVDRLISAIIQRQNPTCVGLDTAFDYLPEELKKGVKDGKDAAKAILAFNKAIVDAVCDIVPAVKVQAAYYEEYGPAGMKTFRKTCQYAAQKGLIVIADAKRNDIGATASRYAGAYFGKPALPEGEEGFPCDFLTVNGYLGTDGILPFAEACAKYDKGIFVLVKTSNPSSGELQDLLLEDGRRVYECMGDMVESWGKDSIGEYGYSRIGAVVGATHPQQAEVLRKRLSHTFFLIPGYGAQGGNAEMIRSCFHAGGMGGIVNNSRGILCAYLKRGSAFDEAARQACLDMKADLLGVLGEICGKRS